MESKTARLNLKILPGDKKALEHLSRSEGESLSVVIRRLLREGLVNRGFLIEPNHQDALRQLGHNGYRDLSGEMDFHHGPAVDDDRPA